MNERHLKGHINMKVLLQNFECCINQKNNHNKLHKFIRVIHARGKVHLSKETEIFEMCSKCYF